MAFNSVFFFVHSFGTKYHPFHYLKRMARIARAGHIGFLQGVVDRAVFTKERSLSEIRRPCNQVSGALVRTKYRKAIPHTILLDRPDNSCQRPKAGISKKYCATNSVT